MTELDLAVDIDVCTSDLILVISKYKGKYTSSAVDSSVWQPVDDGRSLNWTEIEAQSLSHSMITPEIENCSNSVTGKMNHLSFSTTLSPPYLSNEEISVTIDEKNETDQKSNSTVSDSNSLDGNCSYNKKRETNIKPDEIDCADDDESCLWDDDEDPWLGCICGETHVKPCVVFWIQCDSCDTW